MRKLSAGVTFIEMLIVAVILAIAALLTLIGVRFLNQMHREGMAVEMDRRAQVMLNEITKEVRVSKRLIYSSSNTLQFNVYDVSKGYDSNTNPNLFDPTKLGTITYQYMTSSAGSFLQKIVDFPARTFQHNDFRNMISSPGADYSIFTVLNSSSSVEVMLKLNPGYFRSYPRIYKADATIRTNQN